MSTNMNTNMNTNTCEQEQLVGPYFDDELPAGRREAFEAHLAVCEPCGKALAALRAMSASFDHLRQTTLSQLGWARLHDGLAARLREARQREIRRMAEGFAALAAVVMLGCFLWQGLVSQTRAADPLADAAWESALVSGASATQGQVDTDEQAQMAQWLVFDLGPRGNR